MIKWVILSCCANGANWLTVAASRAEAEERWIEAIVRDRFDRPQYRVVAHFKVAF